MTLNTFKCNCLTQLHFNGLTKWEIFDEYIFPGSITPQTKLLIIKLCSNKILKYLAQNMFLTHPSYIFCLKYNFSTTKKRTHMTSYNDTQEHQHMSAKRQLANFRSSEKHLELLNVSMINKLTTHYYCLPMPNQPPLLSIVNPCFARRGENAEASQVTSERPSKS